MIVDATVSKVEDLHRKTSLHITFVMGSARPDLPVTADAQKPWASVVGASIVRNTAKHPNGRGDVAEPRFETSWDLNQIFS